MSRFNGFLRWALSIIIVCTLAFALGGCEGSDGAAGAAGAAGAPGAPGGDGPPGPTGPSVSVTPLESCGVCHDEGSFASAPAHHALPQIESVSNVAFAVNGADMDVSFDLEVDEAPGLGYDAIQRGYRNDGTVRTSITDDLSTLTEIGGGSYTFTIIGGAAQAAIDNRYLFRVAAGEDRETRVYFFGDFPASPLETPQVSAAACTNCHGPEGIDVHGGYFAATDGAEPCLVCHGADSGTRIYPTLMTVAHEYHSGLRDEITFPTYIYNCSVCHSEAPELAAVNAMPVTGEGGCLTCHGSMDSWDFAGLGLDFHLNLTPTPETADCEECHNTGGIAANKTVVTDFHNGLETPRHGFIYDGVDTSIVEAAKFDWAITGMVDDGVNLTFTWQASYDDVGVDPCNDTVGVGAPTFHLGDGGLRTYRSYAQGDDFIIGTSSSAPGQPSRADVDATNTTCAGMIATTVIPVEGVIAEKGRIALGGKPLVESDDVPGLIVEARVPTPTYDWLLGDGTAAVARRDIVDTSLCLNCHVGSLYQHGGDRVDNVDYCMVCHNAAANEQSVRVGLGVDASEAYDGQVGESFELKTMIHRIHSSGAEGSSPYVIYRGRGIYGFAPDVSLMGPNWPGTGPQVVYGSTDDAVINHNFHTPTFPRGLYDCAACHVDGTDFMPDQREAMASTRDAGDPAVWENQFDDVLQGAATTACITCHSDAPAKGHAYQNSWEPQEFPEGRQTIIDAAN